MGERVKGTVFRAGASKFGFYVKLDGNDTFFNTKFEPKCESGDVVGIEFNRSPTGKCNISKITVLEKGKGAPTPQARPGGFLPSGGGSSERQDSIIWQHSQEVAIRAVSVLVSNGAVDLPKAPAARAAIIAGLIDKLTYSFFVDASDPRNSATYKAEAGVQEDAKEPEAEEGEDDGWGDEYEAKDGSGGVDWS